MTGRPVTQPYHRDDLSVDQQHALFTAARRPAEEFSGVFGFEAIDDFLHSRGDG